MHEASVGVNVGAAVGASVGAGQLPQGIQSSYTEIPQKFYDIANNGVIFIE